VRNAMRKLEAHTRVHAVVIALQQGAIDGTT
jgi:DNA-binding CsgD family transcriptional regulator